MHPEQIKSAAVELLDQIFKSEQPANDLINAYTRSRRYIGSKDRRALTDLVFGVLRHRARLCYQKSDISVLEMVEAYQDGYSQTGSFPFYIQNEVPEWLVQHIPHAETELPPLLETASVVIRVNGDRDEIKRLLEKDGIETIPTSYSPFGLIMKKRFNLTGHPLFKAGKIEIQDEGSQAVALQTHIKQGDTVLDYCAGAGGKTLMFAQMMQNKGTIIAHDVSSISLKELQKRTARAGLSIVQTTTDLPAFIQKNPHIHFNHVVVDAPCSGTGTWRRCPDRRWKLTPEQFKKLIETQKSILEKAKNYVPSHGFLSYMTCSLTQDENQNQVTWFLKGNPAFKLIRQARYSPATTRTDGLFVAVLQKTR